MPVDYHDDYSVTASEFCFIVVLILRISTKQVYLRTSKGDFAHSHENAPFTVSTRNK